MTNGGIKLKGLFLDDKLNPQDITWVQYPESIEWVVVRNMEEIAEYMHDLTFDVYSFDYDLEDYWEIKEGQVIGEGINGYIYATETSSGENTGYSVLQTMLYDWPLLTDDITGLVARTKFFFHTKNKKDKLWLENFYKSYLDFIKDVGEDHNQTSSLGVF